MAIDKIIKERAIALRLQGKSYTYIQRKLQLSSKGTLSTWFKDLSIPEKSKILLRKNIERATQRGLLAFNENRSARIIKENKHAEEIGFRLIGRRLVRRDVMIAGACLYWGEGTKSAGRNKTQRIVFTNSDPEMVKLFLRFVREVMNVQEDIISGELHIHEYIEADAAKRYWSDATKLPPSRIWVGRAISSASQKKRPTRRLPYGTFAVRIPGRLLFHQVKGMMQALGYTRKS